jgi:hypothetical protein
MTIINTTNVANDMARKILKASRTNGLKQAILKVIESECNNRRFNKWETLNALNAIERTKFFIINNYMGGNVIPFFKYRKYRDVRDADDTSSYKIDYDGSKMIFHG